MGYAPLNPSYDDDQIKKVRPGFGGSPAARGPDLGTGRGGDATETALVVTRATRAGFQFLSVPTLSRVRAARRARPTRSGRTATVASRTGSRSCSKPEFHFP